jgi:hypothetical protein
MRKKTENRSISVVFLGQFLFLREKSIDKQMNLIFLFKKNIVTNDYTKDMYFD